MEIEILKKCCASGSFRITDHGFEEMENDNISLEDIILATLNGEIIEDYPEDFPLPSCLVFGKNSKNEFIHTVWAYNEAKEMRHKIKIVNT